MNNAGTNSAGIIEWPYTFVSRLSSQGSALRRVLREVRYGPASALQTVEAIPTEFLQTDVVKQKRGRAPGAPVADLEHGLVFFV